MPAAPQRARLDAGIARTLVVAAALFFAGTVVLGASVLHAGTVAKPNTFSNSTVADATQVNANFDTIFAAVNDGESARPYLSARSVTPSLGWSSTSWTGVNGVIALTSLESSGITLSGDDLTFTKAGHYFVSFSTNWWSMRQYMSLRLKRVNGDGATLILRSTYSSTSLVADPGAPPAELQGIISVNAGDTLELQYVVMGGTTSNWGASNPIAGETMVTARLDVFRIR